MIILINTEATYQIISEYWMKKILSSTKEKLKKCWHILDDIDDYGSKIVLIIEKYWRKYWHVLKDAGKYSDSIDYYLKIPNTENNWKKKRQILTTT
jgi:hypothetical protein